MIKREDGGIRIEFPKDLKRLGRCLNFINRNKTTQIIISVEASLDFYSLEFLNRIKLPETIKRLDLYGNFTDYEVVYRFTELSKLSVSLQEKGVIDLSRFPKLKSLATDQLYPFKNLNEPPIEKLLYGNAMGQFSFEPEALNQMTSLKSLIAYRINNFSFKKIPNLSNLEYINFTQCNLISFEGITAIKNLRSIGIDYCRSLKSIAGIVELHNLQKIWFDACPNITDIEVCKEIKNLIFLYFENMAKYNWEFAQNLQSQETLEFLGFQNCGKISSINFLNNMPNLQTLFIYKTKILDGDLTPCLKLKNVWSSNMPYYNVKKEQLPNNQNYTLSRWFLK